MRHRLPSLNAIRAFEAAAREGSFRAAARELNVTPSAISHQVRGLEAQLGVDLFRRQGTRLELTEAARIYLPQLSSAFQQIDQATRTVSRLYSSGRLTVQTYSTIAVRWLVPRLSVFRDRCPEVDVRLFTSQADVDLATGDVDVALRVGESAEANVHYEYLFTPVIFPVCSPGLREALQCPADLASQTILQVYPSHEDWDHWFQSAGVDGVDPDTGLVFDSYDHALATACRGLGVALGMEPYVREDLASGLLVRPFEGLDVLSHRSWYLVCRKHEKERPDIVNFRDWLLAELVSDPSIRPLREHQEQ